MTRFANGANVVPAARQGEAGSVASSRLPNQAGGVWGSAPLPPGSPRSPASPPALASLHLPSAGSWNKRKGPGKALAHHHTVRTGAERGPWKPGRHLPPAQKGPRTSVTLWHVRAFSLSQIFMNNHRPVDWGWGRRRKGQHSYPPTYLSCGGKLWRPKGEWEKLGKMQEKATWTFVVGLAALRKVQGNGNENGICKKAIKTKFSSFGRAC